MLSVLFVFTSNDSLKARFVCFNWLQEVPGLGSTEQKIVCFGFRYSYYRSTVMINTCTNRIRKHFNFKQLHVHIDNTNKEKATRRQRLTEVWSKPAIHARHARNPEKKKRESCRQQRRRTKEIFLFRWPSPTIRRDFASSRAN